MQRKIVRDMRKPLVERFLARVDKSGECWIWKGSTNQHGYGVISHQRRRIYAHRMSLMLSGIQIPAGLCALHKCDNPPCVRPDHLWIGTRAENSRDMAEKGRGPRGERNGSKTQPGCLNKRDYSKWPRGDRHPHAKVTSEIVREMRRLRTELNLTYTDIGSRFGVTENTASSICRGKTWAHIQ